MPKQNDPDLFIFILHGFASCPSKDLGGARWVSLLLGLLFLQHHHGGCQRLCEGALQLCVRFWHCGRIRRLSQWAQHYHGGFQKLCTFTEAFKGCALPWMLSNTMYYCRGFQILYPTTDAFKYCALPQTLLNTVHYCRGFQILCTATETFKGCALPKRLNNSF